MNILILFALREKEKNARRTILDHLYSFSRYDKNNRFYYYNIIDEETIDEITNLPDLNDNISAVIVHYSAIAQRMDPAWWLKYKSKIVGLVNCFDCDKIILPQDDYDNAHYIQEFIKECHITRVYTVVSPQNYDIIYPKELGYKHIETVFTGYVDEVLMAEIKTKYRKNYKKRRPIDIGYRARQLPFWYGKHGQLKVEVGEVFLNYLSTHKTELVYDISNTGGQNQNVLFGDDWISFLLSCRTMLGCLGGSSFGIFDESIKAKITNYMNEHPGATFAECEKDVFPGMDGTVEVYALGPRHFECAMTKTAQVLVEGEYGGIMQPDIDYIEVKKDYSNLDEVIKKIKDESYCRKIANNCYSHVVKSGKYSYRAFVDRVVGNIATDRGNIPQKELDRICKYSDMVATEDYGFLELKYLHVVGLKKALDPKEMKKHWRRRLLLIKHRMSRLFFAGVVITKKTPLCRTRLYAFAREKYKSYLKSKDKR